MIVLVLSAMPVFGAGSFTKHDTVISHSAGDYSTTNDDYSDEDYSDDDDQGNYDDNYGEDDATDEEPANPDDYQDE